MDEIESHPFYTEYLASHDLRWFAGVTISPDPGTWVGISLQRTPRKTPYSDEELTLLNRLGRHVEKALRLGIRLLNAEVANLALGDALARLSVGVFLLDEEARIVFSNRMGQRLIGDALLNAGERLTARFATEREALQTAIAAVGAGACEPTFQDRGPVIVHGLEPDRFLALYVLPARLPTGHAVEALFASATAIVVAIPSAPGDPPDPTIVRDLLGLTLGEARIASLVGSGLPPGRAAEMLGLTDETARTTLKRVFAKVGVSRQSELTALLSRLVLR
jgi:DNA-binding CsgD family transcriptional regulator